MGRDREGIRNHFIQDFGSEPMIIKAPGRINIIGEHTDYNEGYVLPAAIDLAAYIYIQKSGSAQVKLISVDLDDTYSFQINDILKPVSQGWVNYFLGVIDQFRLKGYQLEGFNLMFTSDIPIGSGLSSSAALECGFGKALSELFSLNIKPEILAKIGQMAEHEFAGVKCGIMDQIASCLGREGHVIQLDCRDLSYAYYPADFQDYELVLFDSCVKHNLADSQYNLRRMQCEEGLTAIQSVKPKVKSLRDASMSDLEEAKSGMSELAFRRCKYVIEENARVQVACEAIEQGNIEKVGELMSETHSGLRDEYEVSCIELDTLVDIASSCDGHAGGRMMGGGFGGCTINLVKKERIGMVTDYVIEEYKKVTGIDAKVYQVAISDGVGVYEEKIRNEF